MSDSDPQEPHAQPKFLADIPRFLFIELKPRIRNAVESVSDHRAVQFPLFLDLQPYAVSLVKATYLLGGVIAFRRYAGEQMGVYVTFLKIFGQWVSIGRDGVVPLESNQELQDISGHPWDQFWALLRTSRLNSLIYQSRVFPN
jgi:hypothetical protein